MRLFKILLLKKYFERINELIHRFFEWMLIHDILNSNCIVHVEYNTIMIDI